VVSTTDISVAEVKVAGAAITAQFADALALVVVEESVHLPSQATLHFNDPWFNLFDARTFKIGAAVSVGFRHGGSTVTVFDGEVTGVSLERGRGTADELLVTAMDKGHRLDRLGHTRTFLKQTDSAIAQKIAGDHSLTANVEATSEQHEYVVQHGQTDYDFLRERAARIGYQFWVSGTTLYFKPRPANPGSATTLTWAENLTQLRVRMSAIDWVDQVTVRGWSASTKEAISGQATASAAPVSFTTAGVADHLKTDAATFGTATQYAGQVPVDSANDATALAKSMITRAVGSGIVLRGEAIGNPNIGAGREVTIAGAASSINGTYLLTSVEHEFGAGLPYRTRFTSSGADSLEIADLLGRDGEGGKGPVPGAQWGGLLTGVVTNINDPDKLGRVKVKIPTLGDDVETAWARVASPGAGATRGLEILPEVNDEVLVGFEFGDMQRPVVLGGLWNSKDALPDAAAVADGKVKTRIWKSREGHKIEMTDDSSAPVLKITHSGGKAFVELTKDDVTVSSDKPVTVKGKDVTVEATGTLTLKGQSVSIKGSGGITVDGGSQVTVKGGTIKLN
jgi:uncharacterized protein involved in type VI secretion and phage assembly